MRNAYLIERFGAYIIDIIIISMVASIIGIPFNNTKNTEKLSKEANQIVLDYKDQKIDAKTYVNKALDINYDVSRETGTSSVLSIIIYVLYFIVFQFYNDGQTIGKKLFKIKIKSKGKELTMNNILFRNIFNNSILCNIIICILVLIGRNAYIYGYFTVTALQSLYVVVCALMISFRKDSRSISDFIGNTEVVSLRSDK